MLKIILIVCLILIILYFLAIMPRVFYKPERIAFRTKFFAHRGLHNNHGDAPENSLKAFQRAVEAGVGIEFDVQIAKDGVPVIFHDFTLNRMCGRSGMVRDFTSTELGEMRLLETEERIPTFEQALQLVGGKVPLIVELKANRMDRQLCTETHRILKNYKGIYCIESFHPMVLYWYRKNAGKIMRGQLSDGFIFDPEYHRPLQFLGGGALQALLLNCFSRPDFVAYNLEYQGNLSRKLCRGLFRNPAAAWTVQSEEQLQKARKHFDVFIFDSFYPSVLKKAEENDIDNISYSKR